MRRQLRTAVVVLSFAGVPWSSAFAEPQVREYVFRVQEERRSERWTLTEWLRIKERMKMMDVWLAMFSDPKKDQRLRPEINLVYQQYRGDFTLDHPPGLSAVPSKFSVLAHQGRMQLWLTNLISATTGLRTLNVDLGLEGSFRDSKDTPAGAGDVIFDQHLWATANLRLFGDSIQDTALVLRMGQYRLNSRLTDLRMAQESHSRGLVLGVELQAYLLSFLGVEGNYLNHGRWNRSLAQEGAFGETWDYAAFLEIGFLRLFGGAFGEVWRNEEPAREKRVKGIMVGAKLLL